MTASKVKRGAAPGGGEGLEGASVGLAADASSGGPLRGSSLYI